MATSVINLTKIKKALNGKTVRSGAMERPDGSRCAFGQLLHVARVDDEDMNSNRSSHSRWFNEGAAEEVRNGLKQYGIEFLDLDGDGDPLPSDVLFKADAVIRGSREDLPPTSYEGVEAVMDEALIEKFVNEAVLPYVK